MVKKRAPMIKNIKVCNGVFGRARVEGTNVVITILREKGYYARATLRALPEARLR